MAQLRSTNTIRQRAQALLARVRRGNSAWLTVHDAALPATAALVAGVTRACYPDLAIPLHSRWRHFEAGGVDRSSASPTPVTLHGLRRSSAALKGWAIPCKTSLCCSALTDGPAGWKAAPGRRAGCWRSGCTMTCRL